MDSIYLAEEGGQASLHPESEIQKMLEEGRLTLDRLFWKEGMSEWRPLRDHYSFHVPPVIPPRRSGEYLSPAAPPPPPRPRSSQKVISRKIVKEEEDDDDDDDDGGLSRYRLRRLGAILLDSTLFFGPGLLGAIFFPTNFGVAVGLGFYYIGFIPTQIYQIFRGRSWGKRALDLRVANWETSRKSGPLANVVRFFTHGAFGLCPLSLYSHLPILMYGTLAYAIVDGSLIFYRDRCLHDYCAGTIVRAERYF
jgi:uncharacterized RDD family membrane protein YckC